MTIITSVSLSDWGLPSNMSIDTDVLAAGFAHLWPAGHLQLCASWE